MEHILQFAVNIDDNAIIETIKNSAEKQITNRLYDDIKNIIFENTGYYQRKSEPTIFVGSKFDDFLEQNYDKILDMAAEKLAEKLARTKRGKAILDNFDVEKQEGKS